MSKITWYVIAWQDGQIRCSEMVKAESLKIAIEKMRLKHPKGWDFKQSTQLA